MGSIEDPKAREELRSQKVEVLLQIIKALEAMDLSIIEIEIILKTCGLNAECAARFGAEIRAEKENGHFHDDRPINP